MNRPDHNKDTPTPPRRERAEMDPQERRLWDLDDGDDLLDNPADDGDSTFSDQQKKDSSEGKSAGDVLDHEFDDDEDAPTPVEGSKDPAKSAPPKSSREESRPKESSDRSPKAPKEEKSGVAPSSSQIEKISLGVFVVLILGIVTWVLTLFFNQMPTTDPAISAEFPVQGKNVIVEEIETYWRKPDPDKDRGVRTKTRAIPAGVVTLGKSQGTGALRIFFEDNEDNLVGDSSTVVFANGKFTRNKSASLEIHATDGFDDLGDLPAYLASQIEPWYMIVKEGPGPDARGNEFKEILRLPINTERR